MNEARRQLLKLGTLTAAFATLPLNVLGQYVSKSASVAAATSSTPTEQEYNALATLTAADFAPFVGTVFTTQLQSSAVHVKLVEVQNPPKLAGSPPASPNTYALRFKSVFGPTLKQDTYVFSKRGLPSFAMLVVPSAPGAKTTYYTGQVNRSVQ
jgi:hypothetical protein